MSIINLNDNSKYEQITIDIYKLFKVENILEYSYENHNTWKITLDDDVKSNNENVYFIIDTFFHDAFGHWVFESAIYLPVFKKLKESYPNLKLVLKEEKNYKKLFCKYFNIDENDIVYNIESNNTSFFPSPITCFNDQVITEAYKSQIYKFREYFVDNNDIKRDMLIMPRQTKENYKSNDRVHNIQYLLDKYKDKAYILNTDEITNLKDQIELVQSSKNIILTEGSPFFVNSFFCKNKNIYSIHHNHSISNNQYFSKNRFMCELIKSENNVKEVHELNQSSINIDI